MERERKISDCFIILIIVVIFSTFSIVKLVRANNRLREHLPYLIAGEKIKNFDLIGMNNERITLNHIQRIEEADSNFHLFETMHPVQREYSLLEKNGRDSERQGNSLRDCFGRFQERKQFFFVGQLEFRHLYPRSDRSIHKVFPA